MKKLLVLLIACLALALAACGGDDEDDGGDSGGGATVTTEQPDDAGGGDDSGGAQAGGEPVEVDIPAISFEPAEVTVKAGTTVVWTNSDDLPHTVTKEAGPGDDFDSGNLDPGGTTFEQTFEQKGTVEYVCTIHPGQAGTVIVE